MIELEVSYSNNCIIKIKYERIILRYFNGYVHERVNLTHNIQRTDWFDYMGRLFSSGISMINQEIGIKWASAENGIEYNVGYHMYKRETWKRYMLEECSDEEIAAFEKFHTELLNIIKNEV
jgi:hypothetical protein